MTRKIPSLVLFVNHFGPCLEFYRDGLGLQLTRLYRGKGHPRWAELEGGGLTIALHAGYKGTSLKSANPAAVQFLVKDIKKTLDSVELHGGRVRRPPREIDFRPAELRLVYEATVADPDGNEVEVQQVIREYREVSVKGPWSSG